MVFILDENVSGLIDALVESLGHKARRFPTGTKDKDLLASAQRERLAIITHDQDFAVLSPSETEGVLLLRIHPTWSEDVGLALKTFLAESPSETWKGKLVLIEKEGFAIVP